MKNLKLFAAFVTTSFLVSIYAAASAAACEQKEMQFMGRATKISHHRFNDSLKQICSYQIKILLGNTSAVCPLSESEASSSRFIDANCSLTEGAEISGVIIRRNNTIWVE